MLISINEFDNIICISYLNFFLIGRHWIGQYCFQVSKIIGAMNKRWRQMLKDVLFKLHPNNTCGINQ